MRVFYIIYAVVCAGIAIGVLVCAGFDIVMERKRRKVELNSACANGTIAEPIQSEAPMVREIPKPVEIISEPVSEIDEESADMLISDELAMSVVSYERGAGKGRRGIVNIGSIDEAFERNSVVTIDALKEKGLLALKVRRVKILAGGILHKPLTVKAEAFSVQAVKMIELTGGTVVVLKN